MMLVSKPMFDIRRTILSLIAGEYCVEAGPASQRCSVLPCKPETCCGHEVGWRTRMSCCCVVAFFYLQASSFLNSRLVMARPGRIVHDK